MAAPAPWVPDPEGDDRRTILSALEDAADYRRDQGSHCHDCSTSLPAAKCDDHAADDAVAMMYDELHERIQAAP